MGLENALGDVAGDEIIYNDAYYEIAQTEIDIFRKNLSNDELRDLTHNSCYSNKRIQAALTLIYSDSCSNEELGEFYHMSNFKEIRIAAGNQLGYSKLKIKIHEGLCKISLWLERKYYSFLRIKFDPRQ